MAGWATKIEGYTASLSVPFAPGIQLHAYVHIAGHTEAVVVTIGGHAVLTGTCHGPAINDGSHLRIEGTIDGPLRTHAGKTTINRTRLSPT